MMLYPPHLASAMVWYQPRLTYGVLWSSHEAHFTPLTAGPIRSLLLKTFLKSDPQKWPQIDNHLSFNILNPEPLALIINTCTHLEKASKSWHCPWECSEPFPLLVTCLNAMRVFRGPHITPHYLLSSIEGHRPWGWLMERRQGKKDMNTQPKLRTWFG